MYLEVQKELGMEVAAVFVLVAEEATRNINRSCQVPLVGNCLVHFEYPGRVEGYEEHYIGMDRTRRRHNLHGCIALWGEEQEVVELSAYLQTA